MNAIMDILSERAYARQHPVRFWVRGFWLSVHCLLFNNRLGRFLYRFSTK
jgi:hypothetical protein